VEPIRWLPRAGAFTQGIVTLVTTRAPGTLSPWSTNAVKGVVPVPQESSRTTTTSMVATEPKEVVLRSAQMALRLSPLTSRSQRSPGLCPFRPLRAAAKTGRFRALAIFKISIALYGRPWAGPCHAWWLSTILVRRSYHAAGAVLGRSGRARPSRLHISDYGLPAVIDVDVLDANDRGRRQAPCWGARRDTGAAAGRLKAKVGGLVPGP
jgi:hypothetical protein